MRRSCAQAYFLDWAPMLFTSALSGQRVEKSIFGLGPVRWSSTGARSTHRRVVNTKCCRRR